METITVQSVGQRSAERLTGISFDCTCGRTHQVAMRRLIVEDGALHRVADTIKELGLDGKAMLLADPSTYAVAGRELAEHLKSAGRDVVMSVYPEPVEYADEKAVVRALIDLEPDIGLLIAVGSGTINDIARILSYKAKIPYIVVATAPSMDGYASTGSPLLVNGFKKTYAAASPVALIGDLRVIAQAPKAMVAAGVGDMLAKITALCDWLLAAAVEDEHYCEVVSGLMVRALTGIAGSVGAIAKGEPVAIKELTEGLVLSGLAMQMIGHSRPASGSEHHLSHYWEMKHFAEGHRTDLHGIKVGVATPIVLKLYERLLGADVGSMRMREKTAAQIAGWERELSRCYGPLAEEMIAANRAAFASQDELDAKHAKLIGRWPELKRRLEAIVALAPDVAGLLREVGAPVDPLEIGVTREELVDALRVAKEVRNRYTVLQLADQLGVLDRYAGDIAAELYGGPAGTAVAIDGASGDPDRVYWQAHRGGGAYEAPDNTMAANVHAWTLGGIPEADIRTTRDGVIVCLHDETLARTTDAPDGVKDVPVSELDFAEVRRWDAGTPFDSRFAGERIPSLEEVFEELRGRPERQFYLDLKQVDLDKLGELIDRYGVNRQIIFTHNRQANCKRMKQIAQDVRSMLWIGGSAERILETFREARESGFDGLDQVQLHLNSPQTIDWDGRNGDEWPYAIEPERLREALAAASEAGVDLEVLPFAFDERSIGDLLDLGIRWFATDEPTRFVESVRAWRGAKR
ncbi:iron-containing alcohol dehydrogenase [Paenibacillus flagellatus]|uniref:GP-PDE domain-containing protein n=1 Tax=Paenibacillus flagellatus TaxID=2211139 RepID=A0A2V5KBD2_9BACL|nr:iron-containing alcohol dehydrogenase [Paenibacillus flagellatus]PYI56242.1 hypothetical protein DLM86_04455 [Paenibacillus flagellatus]